MFIVINRAMGMSRFNTRRPNLVDIIEILDTSDCVSEKYAWEEARKIAKTLKVVGIDTEAFSGYGSLKCNPSFDELLDGRLRIKNETLYQNKRALLNFCSDDNILSIKLKSGEEIFACKVAGLKYVSSVGFQWAERYGDFYRVAIRLTPYVETGGRMSDWMRHGSVIQVILWFSETKLEGVESFSSYRNIASSGLINEQYRVSEGLLARMNIYNGGS